VIAYKFLRRGAIGPFSRFAWPTGSPGAWVEAEPHVCASGIHACEVEDLPYWIDAELWELELDGAVRAERKLVARRGRLLRRIESWDERSARAFADSCAAAAAKIGAGVLAADAAAYAASGEAATACFVSARAAETVEGSAGYERERRRQAAWLREHLGLQPA
jgi:hypothetical protein